MLAPLYYKEKDLKVDSWFIITDMREIYRNDFESVRDYFLANITMPFVIITLMPFMEITMFIHLLSNKIKIILKMKCYTTKISIKRKNT